MYTCTGQIYQERASFLNVLFENFVEKFNTLKELKSISLIYSLSRRKVDLWRSGSWRKKKRIHGQTNKRSRKRLYSKHLSQPIMIRKGGFNMVFGSYLCYAVCKEGRTKKRFLCRSIRRRERALGAYRERWSGVESERKKTGKIAWTKVARHKDVSFATPLSAWYQHLPLLLSFSLSFLPSFSSLLIFLFGLLFSPSSRAEEERVYVRQGEADLTEDKAKSRLGFKVSEMFS